MNILEHDWDNVQMEKPCPMAEHRTHSDPHRGEIIQMTSGAHFAKLVCWDCGYFIKWLPKPENKSKNRRSKSAASLR